MIRRAGVTQSLRTIGAGRGAGRGKPKEEQIVNCQPHKALKVDDSVFESVEDGAAATQPMPSSNFFPAAPMAKTEVMTDPYSLKETVKGEPAKPAMAKKEQVLEEEEMDVSVLRAGKDDDGHDAVSESNLSDVQVVEEFPEVELEKTERILEKMGKSPSPGMIELCDNIVMMLNPVTSTPKRSSARSEGSSSSSASTHSSMPPLGDGWSATSDSGNASDNSDAPPTKAVTASDTVTVNSEDFLINVLTMINIFCSRTPHLRGLPADPRFQ